MNKGPLSPCHVHVHAGRSFLLMHISGKMHLHLIPFSSQETAGFFKTRVGETPKHEFPLDGVPSTGSHPPVEVYTYNGSAPLLDSPSTLRELTVTTAPVLDLRSTIQCPTAAPGFESPRWPLRVLYPHRSKAAPPLHASSIVMHICTWCLFLAPGSFHTGISASQSIRGPFHAQ